MDLAPHVATLSRALAAARTAGSEGAEVFTDAFVVPFESAIRLAMLNVLSAAAEEISGGLSPGSVEVRLRGGDPAFVVTAPVGDVAVEAAEPPPRPLPLPFADDGATSRISLRLPERLKARVDEIADREGLSVNAWLGRVVAAAVEHEERQGLGRQSLQLGQKRTGWVR